MQLIDFQQLNGSDGIRMPENIIRGLLHVAGGKRMVEVLRHRDAHQGGVSGGVKFLSYAGLKFPLLTSF